MIKLFDRKLHTTWILTALLLTSLCSFGQTTTQTFTTSGTFTVPAGVTSITVECWGGGGSGGANNGGCCGGGGGGGGAYSRSVLTVTAGSGYTVNVGSGALGVTNGAGQAGGDTWFGTVALLLAKGGSGGALASSGTGGVGGSSSAGFGDVKYDGGKGGNGSNGGNAAGGGGGSSAGTSSSGLIGGNGSGSNNAGSGGIAPTDGGNGGSGGVTGASGNAGGFPGGGGGGSGDKSGGPVIGGNGGDGQVKVSYVQALGIYNDLLYVYTNGTGVETIVFTLTRELTLSEGAGVTGFSVNSGTISSAIYTGKGTTNTITLTSTANGAWSTSTTVTYNSGNIYDLSNTPLGNFSGHTVITNTSGGTVTQTFSSSGSFPVPSGVTSVAVECWGGGGAGGGNSSGSKGGGGGGGGAYSQAVVSVGSGQTYTIAVGSGGIGSNSNGTSGGTSSFTSPTSVILVSASGGTGGLSASTTQAPGAGGSSGVGIGTIKYSGGNGGAGNTSGSCQAAGGGGGSSAGSGGDGGSGQTAVSSVAGAGGMAPTGGGAGGDGGYVNCGTGIASAGGSPGGGGGGAGSGPTAGGAGANGLVKVTYTDFAGPSLSPDVMTFYARGTLVERISFTLNRELSLAEGASVTGFTTSTGSVSTAIYSGKGTTNTITLTSSANANWTSSTTVSYTNGNVAALNNTVMSNITSHSVTDYVAYTTQTFTSSGTFTNPVGNTSITVECWGAGGGGGKGSGSIAGGGGGGGAYAKQTFSVTSGLQYSVTVGIGGSGAGAGATGGDSWFDTGISVYADGGAGGSNPTPGTGGSSGASVGAILYSGGTGGIGKNAGSAPGGGGGSSAGTTSIGTNGGSYVNSNTAGSGGVAPSGGGNGGNGGLSNTNGSNGSTPGGGGGGSGDGGSAGGNGGNGQVKITYVDFGAPSISPNVITLNSNGSLPETLVLTISREIDLSEGGAITGFSVNSGSIANAVYSGKGTTNTVTITSTSNGGFTAGSTVSYTSGNIIDLLGQNMSNFSGHGVTEAGSTLSAGDIAFTGYNSGLSFDEFAFVLLKDISAPTVIYFTDNGWNGTSLQTAETTITWTAGAALQAGTAVKITNSTATQGSVSYSGVSFVLDTNGDNLIAYQGSSSSPVFLAALLNSTSGVNDGSGWCTTATVGTNNNSALPTGLTSTSNAISLWSCSKVDANAVYSTGVTTGSAQQLRSAINSCSNWISTCCGTLYTLTSGVNSFPIIPVIASVSLPNSTMKVGSLVTATITVHDDRASMHALNTSNVDALPLSNLTRTNSTTYTTQFTVTEGGTDVSAGSDVPISLQLTSSQGNAMPSAYTTSISQSNDLIDANSPRVLSINRQSSTNSWSSTNGTSASSVVFRTTFSEDINPATLGVSDFASSFTGSISGPVKNSPVQILGNTVYDLTVSGYSGTGTLGLNYVDNNDVNAVQDLAGNSTITSIANPTGDFTGQTYSIVLPQPSAAVSGFSVTNPLATSLSVQWSNTAIGATHCLVMLKETNKSFPAVSDGSILANDNNMADGIQIANVTFSNLTTTFSGLTNGTTYNLIVYPYALSANNSNDNVDYYTVSPPTVNGLTIPAAPVGSAVIGSSTESAIVPQWALVTGATAYELDVSTSNTFGSLAYQNLNVSGTATSTTASGLSGNTTYYFRVRAKNSSGVSANSTFLSLMTAPANPAGLTTSPSTTTDVAFTLTWTKSTGATDYLLDVSPTGPSNLSVGDVATFTVNSRAASTLYSYTLRAVNSNGTSTGSSGSVTTAPSPPIGLNTPAETTLDNQVTINWTKGIAVSYVLDVSTTNNFSSFVGVYNNFSLGKVSTFTTTATLSPNTLYYYQLRSTNANGTSNSAGASFTTAPAPPANVSTSPTTTSDDSFQLSWSPSTAATDYYLDVSTINDFSSFLANYNNLSLGNVTTYTVNAGLNANTSYYYRLRASNSNGTSNNSSNSVNTAPPPPNTSAASGFTQTAFQANWAVSTNATSYRLDISVDPAFASFVSNSYTDLTVSGTSQAVTGLTAGTTYYYRVRAVNTNGTSKSSSNGSALTIPPDPTGLSSNGFGQSSFTANWNLSTSATSYQLDVSTSNTFSSFVTGYNSLTVLGNSITVTGLTPGSTYYYHVRAVNASGTSNNSSTAAALTVPPDPTTSAPTGFSQTSFTANWNSSLSASSYKLDVSISNTFNSFVTGYNNLSVTGTSSAVTGLTPGTTYYYRVRASNANGTSNSSSNGTALTIPPNPLVTAATTFSQSSFTANWNASTSAVSYRLDVSSSSTYTTFVTGFSDLVVSGTSKSVTGLAAGTTYYYRVRAVNTSGVSNNSENGSGLTIPPDPVVGAASAVATNSFSANWTASTGASGYYLDVSKDNFVNNVVGFDSKDVGAVETASVTGLTPGTVYSYRVRSYNASGTSNSSGAMPQITITDPPTALDPTQVQSSSFAANWSSVTGADQYEVNVVDNSTNVSVTGYPKLIGKGQNEDIVQGLTPSTVYKYFVRGKNNGGFSAPSNNKLVFTLTGSGQVLNPPQVAVNESQGSITSVQAQISSGIAPLLLTLKHRSITTSKFTAEPAVTIATTGTSKTVTVNSSWVDELGMEYYFIIKDAANRVDSSQRAFVYQKVAVQNVPVLQGEFNGSWKMFSIPADIPNNRVDEVFSSVIAQFGGYSKDKWKLFHFNGSTQKYEEYQAGLASITKGEGYWIIASKALDNLPINAGVIQSNQNSPFVYHYQKGWNLIGNPYPFNIDWSAIQNANTSAGLNSLWVYENQYVKKTAFAVWKAAFVFSDNGGDVSYPMTSKTLSAGRVTDSDLKAELDNSSWLLPLSLTLNDMTQTSGIGMHPNASQSKDKFDEMAVPRFVDFIEMTTYHKEFFAPLFSTDVVPTVNKYEWLFTLSSNGSGVGQLNWDNTAFETYQSSMLLVDFTDGVWIDMKSKSTYSFEWKENRQIKILYSRDGKIDPPFSLLGSAYPNPFTNDVQFPVLIDNKNKNLQIRIFDVLGKKITTINSHFTEPGMYNIPWDGKDETGYPVRSGVFFYRMNNEINSTKRLVKR